MNHIDIAFNGSDTLGPLSGQSLITCRIHQLMRTGSTPYSKRGIYLQGILRSKQIGGEVR